MSDSTIADDLKAARALLEKGWYQGGLTDYMGNMCVIGALNKVCCGDIIALFEGEGWTRRDAAVDVLRRILAPLGTDIAEFNDAYTTTHEDVLNLFSKALAELGALA